MNVVVLAEGPSELGSRYKERVLLESVQDYALGALEIVVKRFGQEVFGCEIAIVGLPRLPRTEPSYAQRACLTTVIQKTELMRQVILPCVIKAKPELSANYADAVVITCDADLHKNVVRAVTRLKQDCPVPIVQVTFAPAFEVVLLEKDAIEHAARLQRCSVRLPDANSITSGGGLKEAFVRCIHEAGYRGDQHPGSADFKANVARELSIKFLTGDNQSIKALRDTLGKLF